MDFNDYEPEKTGNVLLEAIEDISYSREGIFAAFVLITEPCD